MAEIFSPTRSQSVHSPLAARSTTERLGSLPRAHWPPIRGLRCGPLLRGPLFAVRGPGLPRAVPCSQDAGLTCLGLLRPAGTAPYPSRSERFPGAEGVCSTVSRGHPGEDRGTYRWGSPEMLEGEIGEERSGAAKEDQHDGHGDSGMGVANELAKYYLAYDEAPLKHQG